MSDDSEPRLALIGLVEDYTPLLEIQDNNLVKWSLFYLRLIKMPTFFSFFFLEMGIDRQVRDVYTQNEKSKINENYFDKSKRYMQST